MNRDDRWVILRTIRWVGWVTTWHTSLSVAFFVLGIWVLIDQIVVWLRATEEEKETQ